MARMKVEQNVSRKNIIISNAATLFKERGYKATSMRDLAEKVGIEAASLYNHITSKRELLNTICFNVAGRFTNKITEVEADERDSLARIEKLLRYHVWEMINNYDEVYVSDREWRNMEDPHLTEYRELRRSYRKRFAAIVQQGINQKELKDMDALTAVMIFLNAIQAVDQWHRIVHKVSSTELEENMVTLMINGIAKQEVSKK